ncbi:uncharacterized protein RJT20DRAFT_133678 [Scheffersomyces xylosifermentans]|uniref:uncharacterized protein n=1 Tax=Scheffersomyces xylosifermentans TaxID=1304137 RepID=UPI00315C9FDF
MDPLDTKHNKTTFETPQVAAMNVPLPPRLVPISQEVPILHNVPSNIIPIIHPPATTSDYFTDLTTDLTDSKLTSQINGIVQKFPPPFPPFVPPNFSQQNRYSRKEVDYADESEEDDDDIDSMDDEDDEDEEFEGGIMVPFIYPPPPVIDPDLLPYSLASFRKKMEEAAAEQAPPPPPPTPPPPPPPTRGRKPRKKSQDPLATSTATAPAATNSAKEDKSPLVEHLYLQVPPLPFPPPNYMPYPLNADKSTLTPHEVFGAFIDAHEDLPRIDMVVASAAGSLFDMKIQATEEGFTIEKYEEEKKEAAKAQKALPGPKKRGRKPKNPPKVEYNESDGIEGTVSFASGDVSDGIFGERPDLFLDSEDERDEGFIDYVNFARNVDTNNYYDFYDENKEGNEERDTNTFEISQRPKQFEEIKTRISNVKRRKDTRKESSKDDVTVENRIIDTEYSTIGILDENVNHGKGRSRELDYKKFLPTSSSKILTSGTRDITSANGNNKERRRKDLLVSLGELTDYQEKHRFEIYRAKKLQLLERLKNLQNSKISFTNSIIEDEELARFKDNLDIERDEELVRLKLVENYELLKNSLTFYQDSNRVYKHLNSIMINKLEKLRNFFEFQRDAFEDKLNNTSPDVFDIKSKDSGRLYSGISRRDYSRDIKQIVKKAMYNELDIQDLEELTANNGVAEDLLNKTPDSHSAQVHDYMPLITPAEFDVITGDLPAKAKGPGSVKENKKNNLKHQIFQNALYERITSGSDTNASDSQSSANTGPKRRGRRAKEPPNPTGGPPPGGDKIKGDGPDSKYSEAALLAKIMKHFYGPQSARSDELNHDLEMMGMKTRWPVPR